MNMFRRLALSSTMALFWGAVSFGQHYTQTDLQANTTGVAEATDPQLVNSWGLSRTSGSAWWVADNATGVATLYNGPGTKQFLTVTIPPADGNRERARARSVENLVEICAGRGSLSFVWCHSNLDHKAFEQTMRIH